MGSNPGHGYMGEGLRDCPGKSLEVEAEAKILTLVTLSLPTSEIGVRFLAQTQVGKLVVACRWLAVYSTEP